MNFRLDELEKLCEAATPGPWQKYPEVPASISVVGEPGYMIHCSSLHKESDAKFIASARTALPELIQEVRRLQSKLMGTESIREMGAEVGKENDELRKQSFEQGLLTGKYIKGYERLKKAHEAISKNSCCDQCQEAKLVSLSALREASAILGEK